MPENTQKQIAQKYKDNLTYYKAGHYLRRWRKWLSILAVVGGFTWALGYKHFGGSNEFFNTGPISENHALFTERCEVCHEGATTDVFSMLPVGHAKAMLLDKKTPMTDRLKAAGDNAWKRIGDAKDTLKDTAKLAAAANSALASLNLSNIDNSCLKCHEGMSMHQPGLKAIMFRETNKELNWVPSSACSTCHKEHVGAQRMATPKSNVCVDCHSDSKRMDDSLKRSDYDGKLASAHSQNVRIDGGDLVHWIPAATKDVKPAVIRAFPDGHPTFLYEQKGAKDNAAIKFNHARHFAADIPVLNGKKIECADCHKADGDGIGMQRIKFEQHCQQCHSLGIDPKLPGFDLPHGSPTHIRDFLNALNDRWAQWAKANVKGMDAAALNAFVQQRGGEILARWPGGMDGAVKKIFFEGEPKITGNDRGQTLPACAKCHEVKDGKPSPDIVDPKIPDQWLTRGPFTHGTHTHITCNECHGAARDSKETSDILLPAQKSCAECHRTRDYKVVELNPLLKIAPTFGKSNPKIAAQQRREGGVFADCLDCHKYHVPAAEMEMAKSLAK